MIEIDKHSKIKIGKWIYRRERSEPGPPLCAAVKKCGRCQKVHKTLNSNVAFNGPNFDCNRGRAKPRHPISSGKGPPRKKIATKEKR